MANWTVNILNQGYEYINMLDNAIIVDVQKKLITFTSLISAAKFVVRYKSKITFDKRITLALCFLTSINFK